MAANKKKLPKGITMRKDGRYMARFQYEGENYTLYGSDPDKLLVQIEDLKYEVRHGIYEKEQNITVDSWFCTWMEEYKKIASRRVKLGLLLSEAGAEAKVTVTADDLNKAIMNEAKKYPGQEKTVFDFYLKNAKAVEALRAPVFEEKIIDYVLGKCKVEEKIVSVEELYAFDDDAKPAKKESKAGKAEKPAKKKKAAAAE